MRTHFFTTSALLLLMGCSPPANEQYCRDLGVAGTPEYGNCIAYYNQGERAYNADRAVCDIEADATYPRSLYDYGRSQPVFGGGGFGGGPWGGGFGGGGTVFIPADPVRNAEVDSLRMRIIGPCMNARGWEQPARFDGQKQQKPSGRARH